MTARCRIWFCSLEFQIALEAPARPPEAPRLSDVLMVQPPWGGCLPMQRWRSDSAVCRRPHRAQARRERAVQYNGGNAEVGGHGSGRFTPGSDDRAAPYTVPMKVVLPQCCTAGAIPPSTFGCLPPGRLWIARPGCSCACVAASRLCSVLTAITARWGGGVLRPGLLAGRAPRAPSTQRAALARAVAPAGSSMRRAWLAGVGGGARYA